MGRRGAWDWQQSLEAAGQRDGERAFGEAVMDREQWEYLIGGVDRGTPEEMAARLDEFGRLGWELIHINDFAGRKLGVVFKRRVIFAEDKPAFG